jgi:hypothetical protein
MSFAHLERLNPEQRRAVEHGVAIAIKGPRKRKRWSKPREWLTI